MTNSDTQSDGRWRQLLKGRRFYWGTFLALLTILIAIGIYNYDFRDTGQNPVSPGQASNIRDTMIIVIILAAALWLGYVVKLLNSRPEVPLSLDDQLLCQLFKECRGMAGFALEQGKAIDSCDAAALDQYEKHVPLSCWSDDAARTHAAHPELFPSDDERRNAIKTLNDIHTRLAKVVAPALPKTLASLMSAENRNKPFQGLGQVKLVRRMLGLVVVLIPTFIALAVNVGVRLDTADGLYSGNVVDKFESAAYIVTASALGAAFAALYKVFGYLGDLSYDDNLESSYWVRFVQGLVSGALLATIIAQTLFESTNPDDPDSSFRVTIPLLALVGGFSSDLLYRILERIIEAIESLVRGSTKERVELEKKRSENRLEQQDLVNQNRIALKTVELSRKLRDAETEAERQDVVDQFQNDVLGGDEGGSGESDVTEEPTDQPTADTRPDDTDVPGVPSVQAPGGGPDDDGPSVPSDQAPGGGPDDDAPGVPDDQAPGGGSDDDVPSAPDDQAPGGGPDTDVPGVPSNEVPRGGPDDEDPNG